MSKEHFDAAVFMRAVAKEARQCSMPNLRYVFSLRGDAFIEQAYLMLLNRESDSVGRNKFAPIAEGRIGKCYILFCLYLSPERTSLPRPLKLLSAVLRRIRAIFLRLRGKRR